ncbi:hypothetical protein GCM10029963_51100 [Micromonospora andamanensis]|uniref:hypothetical protein n=1 Tax=Micromonospora andamanensis TaxID=1287068 RepID=UPI00194F191D|nr:hypothetical protein [Micromonospora andamanensis]GIJ37541.1 hypothetical protein Vwe01_08660 [Micromonospora andamanensis]
MSDIQDPLRREIIAEIYRRADELGWDGLSISERSTWYNQWVDDDQIGGVLTRYMPRERARLWIKDVPMKHYNRARSGIGPYASLIRNPLPGAAQISQLAFGREWVVVEGTLQEKPNRCHLASGAEYLQMIWGTSRNLQSLIWAGLNARVDGGPTPVLVVTTRQGERLSEGEQARHQRLGELAGLEVRHVTTRATRGPSNRAAGG